MVQEVLVIDDDPAIHRLAAAHLGNWQMHVSSAFDGAQGLAEARDRQPDLILLDMDMPLLNGLEVCQRLKAAQSTHDIPVLFLTAAATINDKFLGFEMGATDYVTKPFDAVELRARTRAALNSRNAMEALASKAMIDGATALYNRAYFARQLPIELARARRFALPLACLVLEIDRFAEMVDREGAAAGDEVLRKVAAAITQACRIEDLVCRHGEKRFVVLASPKDAVDVMEFANRLRASVRDTSVQPLHSSDAPWRPSASVGVAISRFSFGYSIVTEAEDALAAAIQAGGDRVIIGGTVAEMRLVN